MAETKTKTSTASAPEKATEHAGSAEAKIAPATTFSTSGAPVQVVPDVDPEHPAVDNDPRAGTTIDQNRIDFNDPKLSGAEAVEKNLADQAKG